MTDLEVLRSITGSVVPSDAVTADRFREDDKEYAQVLVSSEPSAVARSVGLWWGYVNPSTAQTGPSCAGHAFANLVEALIRKYMPEDRLAEIVQRVTGQARWQLDGERIYAEARALWYPDSTARGGLTIEQVLRLAEMTGLLGSVGDYEVIRVKPTWEAMSGALSTSPILVAAFLSPTWLRPDPLTGWIRPGMPDLFSGHLMCATSVARTVSGDEFVFLLNSWGSSWGRYGYGVVNLPFLRYSWLDDGIAFLLVKDWWVRSSFERWVIPHYET